MFRDFFGPNDPEKHWVDIGNSSSEALAARVAQMRGGAPGDLAVFEDIVSAFLTGLLSLGLRRGPAMDAELPARSLQACVAENAWVLEPQANVVPKDGGVPSSERSVVARFAGEAGRTQPLASGT